MVVFSKLTAVVAGLSAVASAAPAPNARKGFTLSQVAKKVTQPKYANPASAYAHALSKYGAPVPDHVLAAAASSAGQGSVTTNPQPYDEEYLTQVNVGGTTLNLDFDTGSADLWVFSNELPASEQSGHNIYQTNPNKLLSGETWSITYGDGSSASGNVYIDSVSVGAVNSPQQAVEAAQQISTQFQQSPGDGLLGLAFSSINTVSPNQQTTFFDSISSSLNSPVFCANLKHNAPGTYDFGYVDSTKYQGQIAYTYADNSRGFWGFTSDGYSVGGGPMNQYYMSAIADTGTTLLLVDTQILQDYYSNVSGAQNSQSAGGWVFPCNAQLPDFSASINGYTATVPGSYIKYAPIDSTGQTCYGGLQDDSGVGFAIFGDIFLKSQYVVFDASGPYLGFAPQA